MKWKWIVPVAAIAAVAAGVFVYNKRRQAKF